MNTSVWSFPFCPSPSDWTLDWSSLQLEFDWLQSLADCPQDPRYHAEGDVLTHTRLVCEALISLPAWQELAPTERSLVFAAALLHDVAKPAATEIATDGSISSKGHVRQGAKMARQILMDLKAPFHHREAVVNLVQYGSLPLWFWDKQNPQRSVIKASQLIQCNLLALLAEADVKGRECNDQAQLLERIDFFREYCQENNCFEHPRPFPSSHSRFVYFHKEDGDPDYIAYDDTRFEVILMSGLPGAGKDYWIQEHLSEKAIISLDQLRQSMNISPEDDQAAVINHAKTIAKEYMRAGKSFVWNATNISRQLRSSLINLFSAYHAKIQIVYLETAWEDILQRNRTRTHKVPEVVMEKLRSRLEVPDITEAHTIDWIVDI